MNLYLDDIRTPKNHNIKWHIVRTYDDAVAWVMHNGMPTYCSFDHDLGLDESGYDFAKWMVNEDLGGIHKFPYNFKFNVHSANPVGKQNIETLLNNYLSFAKVSERNYE